MGHGAGDAIRTQLFFPEQHAIYDLWLSLKGDAEMPRRADLNPLALRDWLARVSLSDLMPAPEFMRVRLAGTALREIYGCELTGRTLQDPFFAPTRDYWTRVCELMNAERRPLSGILKGPGPERDHLVLFWMRLPLLREDGGIVMLGLDQAISVRRLDEELPGVMVVDGIIGQSIPSSEHM